MGDDTRKVKSEPLRVDPILHSAEFRAMAANLESMASALAAANERADKAEADAAHWKEIGTNECVDREAEHAEFSDLLTSARSHAARWKALAKRYMTSIPGALAVATDELTSVVSKLHTERDQLRAEVERLRDGSLLKLFRDENADLRKTNEQVANEREVLRKKFVAANAEVERLRGEMRDFCEGLRAALKEVKASEEGGFTGDPYVDGIDALRAALKRYGRHTEECKHLRYQNESVDCYCGYSAALNGDGT